MCSCLYSRLCARCHCYKTQADEGARRMERTSFFNTYIKKEEESLERALLPWQTRCESERKIKLTLTSFAKRVANYGGTFLREEKTLLLIFSSLYQLKDF